MSYAVGQFGSLNIGIMTFLIGWRINRHIPLLQRFSIPEPVTGGLSAMLVIAGLHYAFGMDITFDLTFRDWLLLYFFTTIGINANLKKLVAGGPALFLLLGLTVVLLFAQNFAGVFLAKGLGLDAGVGLLGGTLALVGGHGTVIAWVPELERTRHLSHAMEIGTACATFGLVLSSVIGGPLANFLITRRKLEPREATQPDIGTLSEGDQPHPVDYVRVLRALLVIQSCIIVGWALDAFLKSMGVMLPLFVSCLLVGIVSTNTIPHLLPRYPWPAQSLAVAVIADIALGVFLAMSLMDLKIWNVLSLALPILFILAAQTVLVALFILCVIFPLMGRDYDAAVISAGFAGFALGSTPTAIANMTAVTERWGASHKAFIVVPLVCSFFIDIANSGVTSLFLNLF